MAPRSGDSRRTFPITPWSLIAKAANASAVSRHHALEELLRRYLQPLRIHLVRIKKIDAGPAEDLLQGFIASKVLEQELLSRARQGKGRFRSFILTALDFYVIDQCRTEKIHSRFSQPLDPAMAHGLSDGHPGPEHAVDLAWAQEVLQTALDLMREECRVGRCMKVWELFAARVVEPTLSGNEPASYGQIVAQLGFESPAQASDSLVTAKRMYVRVLRRVVGEYAEEGEVDAEILHLREILARPRA